jgi:opacity protein-like surface antigen
MLTLIYKLRNNLNMRKNIAIFLSFLFISITSVKAETMIGITGALHMLDVSGTETTRSSGERNTGSESENAVVPEFFIEKEADGVALGLSYVPTKNMGSKSRTDTNSEGSSGTYRAEAELSDVIQLYVDYTVSQYAGADIYLKGGLQFATIETLESLNSGSTYPNEDVYGFTLGIGAKGALPYGNNLFYKADITYTEFTDYENDDEAGTGNKVEADLNDTAVKFSVGYKF